jgi:hypothetical protein
MGSDARAFRCARQGAYEKKKGRGLLLAPDYSLENVAYGEMLVVTLWLKLPP